MDELKNKTAFISDMDGVIYHGNNLLPGAADFIRMLDETGKKYLFLTNSSERTPRELAEKLARLGVRVEPEHFYTSALATADFLSRQKQNCSVLRNTVKEHLIFRPQISVFCLHLFCQRHRCQFPDASLVFPLMDFLPDFFTLGDREIHPESCIIIHYFLCLYWSLSV